VLQALWQSNNLRRLCHLQYCHDQCRQELLPLQTYLWSYSNDNFQIYCPGLQWIYYGKVSEGGVMTAAELKL
jgi:hypothetical protein